MIFILGLLTGLILATIVLIITLYSKPKVERTINQIASKTRQKGSILEPENEELEQWLSTLKKDE